MAKRQRCIRLYPSLCAVNFLRAIVLLSAVHPTLFHFSNIYLKCVHNRFLDFFRKSNRYANLGSNSDVAPQVWVELLPSPQVVSKLDGDWSANLFPALVLPFPFDSLLVLPTSWNQVDSHLWQGVRYRERDNEMTKRDCGILQVRLDATYGLSRRSLIQLVGTRERAINWIWSRVACSVAALSRSRDYRSPSPASFTLAHCFSSCI